MIRLGVYFLASILLSACSVGAGKSVSVSMTHENAPIAMPVMAAIEDDLQKPIRCEKFLSSIALAEQKTAQFYKGYAL